MARMIDADPRAFSPHIVAMVRRPWKAGEFTAAMTTRKRVTNLMWRFMQRYDLLLTPTVAVPAFPVDTDGPSSINREPVDGQAWTPFAYIMNLTGQPAISVPAGRTRSGLPVGLQICGPHLGDAQVLRAAAAFESAAPWINDWPPSATE
jgi:aspartyl-tRNA(Asn)/glutamyl-tRNA(Gln) amidotransferase subunit A